MRSIYGSRLFGTTVATSDTDYKTIYMPSVMHLYLGKSLKNVAEGASKEKGRKNTSSDVDGERIAIQTFARDFVAGQTYALELAWSPSVDDPETHPEFRRFVKTLHRDFLTCDIGQMLRFSRSQAAKYGAKGDRYNSIVNLIELIGDTVSYMGGKSPFDDKRLREIIDHFDKRKIDIFEEDPNLDMVKDETHMHLVVCGKMFPLDTKVYEVLARLNKMKESYGARAKEAAEMDGADWKAIMHAYRVICEAQELLTQGRITHPVPEPLRSYLVEVRQGLRPLEEITKRMDEAHARVNKLIVDSKLPSSEALWPKAADLVFETMERIIGMRD